MFFLVAFSETRSHFTCFTSIYVAQTRSASSCSLKGSVHFFMICFMPFNTWGHSKYCCVPWCCAELHGFICFENRVQIAYFLVGLDFIEFWYPLFLAGFSFELFTFRRRKFIFKVLKLSCWGSLSLFRLAQGFLLPSQCLGWFLWVGWLSLLFYLCFI